MRPVVRGLIAICVRTRARQRRRHSPGAYDRRRLRRHGRRRDHRRHRRARGRCASRCSSRAIISAAWCPAAWAGPTTARRKSSAATRSNTSSAPARSTATPIQWHLEPHVAEDVFKEMVKEAGVEVFYRHRLREKTASRRTGTRITAITMENGATFAAAIFADATYEGDLMAQAGVSYTWGREGTRPSMASRSPACATTRRSISSRCSVHPRDANGKLLPEISPATEGAGRAAPTRRCRPTTSASA